jgi:hypothetical protein
VCRQLLLAGHYSSQVPASRLLAAACVWERAAVRSSPLPSLPPSLCVLALRGRLFNPRPAAVPASRSLWWAGWQGLVDMGCVCVTGWTTHVTPLSSLPAHQLGTGLRGSCSDKAGGQELGHWQQDEHQKTTLNGCCPTASTQYQNHTAPLRCCPWRTLDRKPRVLGGLQGSRRTLGPS